jgi:hypothetical protein
MFRQNEASYLKFLLRYSVKIKLGEITFNQEFENHMKDQDRADVLKHILGHSRKIRGEIAGIYTPKRTDSKLRGGPETVQLY